MQIEEIQEVLNKNTKKKVNADFRTAAEKCVSLLRPFFIGKNYCSLEEINEQQKILSEMFHIAHESIVCSPRDVHPQVLIKYQNEESKKLINKIASLTEELEELKNMTFQY